MEAFRGRSLGSIILFTVVVHLVLLVGTSVPFLYKSVMGADTSGMSEEERIESAVKEATASLREIAEEHGLKPQDLSSQFAGGKPRTPKAPRPETTNPSGSGVVAEPEEPKTVIEQELNKVEAGPSVPTVEDEDEEEDLFK